MESPHRSVREGKLQLTCKLRTNVTLRHESSLELRLQPPARLDSDVWKGGRRIWLLDLQLADRLFALHVCWRDDETCGNVSLRCQRFSEFLGSPRIRLFFSLRRRQTAGAVSALCLRRAAHQLQRRKECADDGNAFEPRVHSGLLRTALMFPAQMFPLPIRARMCPPTPAPVHPQCGFMKMPKNQIYVFSISFFVLFFTCKHFGVCLCWGTWAHSFHSVTFVHFRLSPELRTGGWMNEAALCESADRWCLNCRGCFPGRRRAASVSQFPCRVVGQVFSLWQRKRKRQAVTCTGSAQLSGGHTDPPPFSLFN